MDKVKIGFVGCGSHSTHNLYPVIKYAKASLEAVCDQNRDLAERNMAFPGGRMAQLLLGSQVRIQERFEISGRVEDVPGYYIVDNVSRIERHKQNERGVDLSAPTLDAIDPIIDISGIEVWRPDMGIPNMAQSRVYIQGFVSEVREFCNAVIEKREPRPSGDDALLTMRVLEAIAVEPNGVTEFS